MDNLAIDGFEWDAGNFEKNLRKHAVSFREIEEVFFNHPLMLFSDSKHSDAERRYIAFGRTHENRLLTLAFTLRERRGLKLLRPISARAMSRKERKVYEEALAKIEG